MSSTSNIYLGNLNMEGAYFGGLEVEAMYLGENEVYSNGPFTGLKLKPRSLVYEISGGTSNLTVKSSEAWTLNYDSTILSCSPSSGDTGETVVTVTAQPNTSGVDITSDITGITTNYSATTNVTISGTEDYSKKPFTFHITSPGYIRFACAAQNNPRTIEYSKDNGQTWTSITSTPGAQSAPFTGGTLIQVSQGDVVQFRGQNTSYGGASYYNSFEGSTCGFYVDGNITSLIYGSSFTGQTTISGTIQTHLFRNFFSYCDGLTSMQNLILTQNLGNYMYSWFAQNCTSLTAAPELPATTLKNDCYQSMFQGCTSLTAAPELPATTLAYECYRRMFRECTSLTYIKSLATNISAYSCLQDWLLDASATGTFVKPASTTYPTGTSGIPSGWTVVNHPSLTLTPSTQTIPASGGTFTLNILSSDNYKLSMDNTYLSANAYKGTPGDREVIITVEPNTGDTDIVTTITATTSNYTAATTVTIGDTVDYSTKYLTMKANSAGNIVWMVGANGTPKTISYSLDSGSTWSSITSTTNGVSIPVSAGDEVLFKGTNERYQASGMEPSAYRNAFYITDCDVEVEGNIMSMIYGDNFENQTSLSSYALTNFFFRCSGITSVENLVLPATTLNTCCYEQMFYECTGITKAPVLPAATLSMMSYASMFNGCTSLNYVKCLASNRSALNCTMHWLNNVAATGTFVKASGSTWPTGADGIPSGWTVIEE